MKNDSRQQQEQEKNGWREKQNKGRSWHKIYRVEYLDWIQLLQEIKNESFQ